jgi:hypothetical protein
LLTFINHPRRNLKWKLGHEFRRIPHLFSTGLEDPTETLSERFSEEKYASEDDGKHDQKLEDSLAHGSA